MSPKPGIPAKPASSVDELILQFGSEEGLVEAFVLHQLTQDDHQVISPTWLTCCLLRRVLSSLDQLRATVAGEPAFDAFPKPRPRRRLIAKKRARR